MKDDISRRELLRGLGRWACLSAVGVWLGGVALRQSDAEAGRTLALCRGCRSLNICSLPGGVDTRRALGRRAVSGDGDGPPTDRLCAADGLRRARDVRKGYVLRG